MLTKTDATKVFLSRCLWVFALCLLSYSVFDVIIFTTAQLEHEPSLVDLNMSVFRLLVVPFLLHLGVYTLQLLYLVWAKHVSWSRRTERHLGERELRPAASFPLAADAANPEFDLETHSIVEDYDLEPAKRGRNRGKKECSQAFTQHQGLGNEETVLRAPLNDQPQELEALPRRLSVVLGLWAAWLDDDGGDDGGGLDWWQPPCWDTGKRRAL